MNKLSLAITFTALSLSAQAATLSISGNARVGSNLYSNLDVTSGNPTGSGGTSSFLEHRILLRPDVIVDDRFSLKSEISLLQAMSDAQNVVPENFGAPFDGQAQVSNGKQYIYLRRAYMEWASDWGIFRAGRQPKSWGLGILYNAGNDVFDDYGTTVDRVGFQALLGNLGLNLGYEKAAEGKLNNDNDDMDVYEFSIDYSNPETFFDVGILYSRNVVSASVAQAATNSSHVLSVFSRKKWGDFQLGTEFNSVAQDQRSGTLGLLAQADWTPGNSEFSFDFGYASGAADTQYSFHPNYKPFMILFRQDLGPTADPRSVRLGTGGPATQVHTRGVGSNIAAGDGNGALFGKFAFSYGFDAKKYVLGTDIGYAMLARQGTDQSKGLGVEWDLHLTQKWYENFKTVYGLGLLFPGHAFGDKPQVAWGLQIRGALTF